MEEKKERMASNPASPTGYSPLSTVRRKRSASAIGPVQQCIRSARSSLTPGTSMVLQAPDYFEKVNTYQCDYNCLYDISFL